MSSNLKVELNSDGIRELLHECGETICAELARDAAGRADAQYDVKRMGTRTIASVFYTDDTDGNKILRSLK